MRCRECRGGEARPLQSEAAGNKAKDDAVAGLTEKGRDGGGLQRKTDGDCFSRGRVTGIDIEQQHRTERRCDIVDGKRIAFCPMRCREGRR